MNEDKLLEINELMSKVLTGKIEHLREARKAKTLLEELIKNCKSTEFLTANVCILMGRNIEKQEEWYLPSCNAIHGPQRQKRHGNLRGGLTWRH